MRREQRARYFAEIAHTGQVYDKQIPYSAHLEMVAKVLERFTVVDEDLYCAAWLHDTIEDTRTSYGDIKELFGECVAELVFAVTNEVGRNRKERSEKTYPKLRAAGRDAMVLKLADHIANVEFGAATGGKAGMYRKEFSGFRAALYDPKCDAQLQLMWEHLSSMMSHEEHVLILRRGA